MHLKPNSASYRLVARTPPAVSSSCSRLSLPVGGEVMSAVGMDTLDAVRAVTENVVGVGGPTRRALQPGGGALGIRLAALGVFFPAHM